MPYMLHICGYICIYVYVCVFEDGTALMITKFYADTRLQAMQPSGQHDRFL